MNSPQHLRILAIPGDGIGPELVDSALEVLHTLANRSEFQLSVEVEPGGATVYREIGTPLHDGALERMRAADGVIKGPVGLPDVRRPDGTEGGLLGGVMRGGLDTFANVRPIRLIDGVPGPTRHTAIDYVIVRENTEGLYLSRGAGVVTPDAACDQMLITRTGTERVARYAFDLARARAGAPDDGVHRVTCVDKSNVLRAFALFRSVVSEVAAEYPDVELDFRYADAAAHDLVAMPGHFDVVLTENFLGDILSDLGAATVGGLGMCGSGNIGHHAAYFEPIHGSAPTIAGTGRANPTSQILSAAMLLDHVGLSTEAERVRTAVESAFADGAASLTANGQPIGGIDAVTDAVIERL